MIKNSARIKPGAVVGCILLASSIVISHEGADHGSPAATVGNLGPVALSDETKLELGILTEEVDLRSIDETIAAYGLVEAKPEAIFWASTRISGRAIAVNFNAGDSVRKGDVLAEIESRQVAQHPIRVPLKSLIDGTITERNISVGQSVEPDSVLFRVMHLETVNVRLDIYEADAARIKLGQRAQVYPEVASEGAFEGPIVRIGGALDEMTRTLPVWVELRNPGTRLRPGMRVRAELVAGTSTDIVAVPRASVLGASGNLFVFLDKGDYYVGQPVGVGRHDQDYAEITDGLVPGDIVVTRGAYQVQFAAAMSTPASAPKSAAAGDAAADESAPEDSETDDAVKLGAQLNELARRNLGLRTEDVDFRVLDRVVRCFGTFATVPANVHHISTRIAGRVTQVYVAEGQVVKEGQTMAEIESLQIADPPPIITARATLSGVVIQRHVFAGEPVDPDKSLFTIANLGQLLVKCHVYEADLAALKAGQTARIYVEAFAGRVFKGRLEYFSGQIDPATRTLLAFVRVQNSSGQLRPNMRAEVHFIVGRRDESIAISRSAVLHPKSDNPFVFVQNGDTFRREAVVLGAGSDRYYEILDGLLPGDTVVVTGARGLEFATNSPPLPEAGPPRLRAAVESEVNPEPIPDPKWWERLKFWNKSE